MFYVLIGVELLVRFGMSFCFGLRDVDCGVSDNAVVVLMFDLCIGDC